MAKQRRAGRASDKLAVKLLLAPRHDFRGFKFLSPLLKIRDAADWQ